MIITGGSRGIGAAVARRAAGAGYAVAVNYTAHGAAAERLVGEIEGAGGRAVALQADVAVEADVVRLYDEATAALGAPTAVVNNAGITAGNMPVAEFDADNLARLFAINVLGVMISCREAVRRMSTKRGGSGGAIVNVSSLAAATGGHAHASHYASSKAAVDVFTVGMAKEVAGEGIRVNVLRPGMTRTDMTARHTEDPADERAIAGTIAMNRLAEADEIAAPILWLLSDEASYVTGSCYEATGGGMVVGLRPGNS